jgi:hypothetical protein
MVLRHTQQSRRNFNATHYRDEHGRFAKRPQPQQIKYYDNQNDVPEYVYNPVKGGYEKIMYRAVVTLNSVPIHSDRARGKPRYKNFSWAKIDYYENINIDDMKKHLLQEIANHFHCKIDDLWFYDGDGETYFDIEMPKPYNGSQWEGLEYGEY